MATRLEFDTDKVGAFCQRWGVAELSLFGSVLRDDFGPASDVDVLIELAPESTTSYWDWADMIAELEGIFGRKVDLVAKGALRNPFRRGAILSRREVIHGG